MQSTQETLSSHALTSSITRSTFFGMVNSIVQVLTRLVTVPIVIHHLGLDGYGIWNVIMVTATYMRFGSVGVRTAFQKYVAEATGNGDYDRANELLSTGTAIMLGFSIAGLIPVALFSKRIAHLSGVPMEFLESAAQSISLLAVIMLMSNVCGIYEAIVMGGHRIDLLRKLSTVLAIGEAVAIVTVLHFGYGLAAMAAVMGTSELVYVTYCYFASLRIVPEIRLGMGSLRKNALYEFFRFAGSYQLVNLMEIAYNSLIPVTVLRSFGANAAGVFAVVSRIVGSVRALQDSFLVPIVSAGTMVFATGSAQKIRALLSKAFKVNLGLSLFPLGFIAVFGPTVAFAWTGQTNSAFRMTFWLLCVSSFFMAFSMLALVLYRATGKVLLDNIRQVLRISVIVAVVGLAPRLGFLGVLSGLAACELAGMLFMFYALAKTFDVFRAKVVLPGMIRLSAASILILFAGVAAFNIPLPGYHTTRLFASLKLIVACFACLVVAWPLLTRTGSVTENEKRALLMSLFPWLNRKNV